MENKLLDNIKFIIYFIVSFNTDHLFIQKGGATTSTTASAASAEIEENNSKNISNKIDDIETTEEAEKVAGQNIMEELFVEIKNAIKLAYQWCMSGVMNWFVIPVMFASVAPSIPFLGVMAALAATMKYIVWHFRKL
tara:strand:- start:163 stop:573 length:411 start_codon:yes stop_codon:yes gene_type:complete